MGQPKAKFLSSPLEWPWTTDLVWSYLRHLLPLQHPSVFVVIVADVDDNDDNDYSGNDNSDNKGIGGDDHGDDDDDDDKTDSWMWIYEIIYLNCG